MIIVTGATSRTGGVVARRLLAAGETVRAVGRSRDRLQELVDLGAEALVGGSLRPGPDAPGRSPAAGPPG